MSDIPLNLLYEADKKAWQQFWKYSSAMKVSMTEGNTIRFESYDSKDEKLENTQKYMFRVVTKYDPEVKIKCYDWENVQQKLSRISSATLSVEQTVFWKLNDIYLVKRFFTCGLQVSSTEKTYILEVGVIPIHLFARKQPGLDRDQLPLDNKSEFKAFILNDGLFYVPEGTEFIFIAPEKCLFKFLSKTLQEALILNPKNIYNLTEANDTFNFCCATIGEQLSIIHPALVLQEVPKSQDCTSAQTKDAVEVTTPKTSRKEELPSKILLIDLTLQDASDTPSYISTQTTSAVAATTTTLQEEPPLELIPRLVLLDTLETLNRASAKTTVAVAATTSTTSHQDKPPSQIAQPTAVATTETPSICSMLPSMQSASGISPLIHPPQLPNNYATQFPVHNPTQYAVGTANYIPRTQFSVNPSTQNPGAMMHFIQPTQMSANSLGQYPGGITQYSYLTQYSGNYSTQYPGFNAHAQYTLPTQFAVNHPVQYSGGSVHYTSFPQVFVNPPTVFPGAMAHRLPSYPVNPPTQSGTLYSSHPFFS